MVYSALDADAGCACTLALCLKAPSGLPANSVAMKFIIKLFPENHHQKANLCDCASLKFNREHS